MIPNTSAAHQYLLLAEQSAPEVDKETRAISRAAVIGAGTMGSGIAMAFAKAGVSVALHDTNSEALAAGLARVQGYIASQLRRGRLNEAEAEAIRNRVSTCREWDQLSQTEFVIEAVFENMVVKQAVMARAAAVTQSGVLIATNTSTLDVDSLAQATGRAEDVVGMHFFSPAHVMRLVEIVRGSETSAPTLATAVALTHRLGKLGVVVGNGFGFVGNRMFYAYGREKEMMLLEGASVEQIDRALEDFGMAMGPNTVGDLAGLDVGVKARREWSGRPQDPRWYRVSELLVENGRVGQKNGAGFYRYDPGKREREPDAAVEELIRAEAHRLGVRQHAVSDDEIVGRCILAMVNEGVQILSEGLATCSGDIDVIWCNGYGFPRDRGGPMFYAEALGLAFVLQQIRYYQERHGPAYWAPSPLLEKLVQDGRRLSDWRGCGLQQ